MTGHRNKTFGRLGVADDQLVEAEIRNIEQLVLAVLDAAGRPGRYTPLAIKFGLQDILRRLTELRRVAR
jgi:hypothetical protein